MVVIRISANSKKKTTNAFFAEVAKVMLALLVLKYQESHNHDTNHLRTPAGCGIKFGLTCRRAFHEHRHPTRVCAIVHPAPMPDLLRRCCAAHTGCV